MYFWRTIALTSTSFSSLHSHQSNNLLAIKWEQVLFMLSAHNKPTCWESSTKMHSHKCANNNIALLAHSLLNSAKSINVQYLYHSTWLSSNSRQIFSPQQCLALLCKVLVLLTRLRQQFLDNLLSSTTSYSWTLLKRTLCQSRQHVPSYLVSLKHSLA